jgi:predicted nuclease of predicted toxin-antitoxin system
VRILADENVPLESVQLLRADGHDVVAAAEGAAGAADDVLLEMAADQRRIILTFDRDFGALIYRRRRSLPDGVVYLRLVPATPTEPALLVRALLDRRDLTLHGRFTVVDRELIRQRPLPTRSGSS